MGILKDLIKFFWHYKLTYFFIMPMLGMSVERWLDESHPSWTHPVLWTMVATSGILDFFLAPWLLRHNYKGYNLYVMFHQWYGVKRVTILKPFSYVLSFYSVTHPSLITPAAAGIFIDAFLVVKLIADAFIPINDFQRPYEGKTPNNLDSFMGLLVYPIRSLYDDRRLQDYQSLPIKWSWKAFLLPEYWYLYNEILGAGLISWIMLIVYITIWVNYDSFYVLSTILAFRVCSGLYGTKIYFARHGKLPT